MEGGQAEAAPAAPAAPLLPSQARIVTIYCLSTLLPYPAGLLPFLLPALAFPFSRRASRTAWRHNEGDEQTSPPYTHTDTSHTRSALTPPYALLKCVLLCVFHHFAWHRSGKGAGRASSGAGREGREGRDVGGRRVREEGFARRERAGT